MFKLYAGLVRDGKYFNHAELEPELKGGHLALMDSDDKSGIGMAKKLAELSVKRLKTADGETTYEMKPDDYLELKVANIWKIALEMMKQITKQENPIFPEYFFCPTCSSPSDERYTEINESWNGLIEQGIIDEIYAETPDEMRKAIELPVGLDWKDPNGETRALKHLTIEPLSLREAIDVAKYPGSRTNPAHAMYVSYQLMIREVKGVSEKDLNRLLRRNLISPPIKSMLVHQEDIDLLGETKTIGLDARFRSVLCKRCNGQIGGHLDFTNFFGFLFGSTQRRGDMMTGM